MTAASGETGDEKDADELTESAFNLRSVFLSVVVMATCMTPGSGMAFVSIALPQMKLNLDEVSWFTSLPALAAPFGNLFIGLTLDAYGRRVGMFANIIPNTIGWFLLADEQASLARLYLGQSLIGFAIGACILPCVVYVAESITAHNLRLRSAVGTWVIFAQVIGGLLVYLLSLILKYDKVALACCIASTISFFSTLALIPESPAWLYQKGRVGDAEIARLRLGIWRQSILRAKTSPPAPSLRNSATLTDKPKLDSRFPQNVWQYLAQIGRRDVYKPLMITIALVFACRFSGVYALLSNMVDVITVSPLESDRYTLSLVDQIVQIIGCSLLSFLLPRYGVKILATVSFLGASASYLILAICILFENRSSVNVFNYLHILSVWSITLAAQLGMFSIPHAVLGELFPVEAKGYATITLSASAFFNFVVMKIFAYAFSRHKNVVFFVFSAVCALGATFVATCPPETVGKTLKEINEGFGRRVEEGGGVEGESSRLGDD